jgi:hypothetical protein
MGCLVAAPQPVELCPRSQFGRDRLHLLDGGEYGLTAIVVPRDNPSNIHYFLPVGTG